MNRKPITSLCAALLALAPHLPAAAQQDERLFRVELMIFTHETVKRTAAESWEATPRLAYPNAARFLVNESRVATLQQEFDGESELDAFGRQLITLPPDAREPPTPVPAATPHPDTDLADPPEEPLYQPFVTLERERRELSPGAARMNRSGRYQLLFHESWIQPVSDRGSALPIVIDRSGDTGEWPLLQGSILLYLSRYLHLETDLWLNTDGSYLPGTWWLPPPPLAPPSVLVDGLPLPAAREAAAQAEAGVIESAQTVARTDDFFSLASPAGAAPDEEAAPPPPPWPWRHAVRMQQKRRMRSQEVHYLDHPLLGVVIVVTPFDPEARAAELEAARRAGAAE